MKPTKSELLVLWTKICIEDDRKSFEALYRALYTRLLKFCTYFVGSKDVAQDIVTEVFVKCWGNRKTGINILNIESYLFIAIKYQSAKHLRKNPGMVFIDLPEDSVEHPIARYTPESILERKELKKQLENAIETLPPQAKIIFRLIKESGMKYKEVAEILEISPRTVQTQLFRALAKLRLLLRPLNQSRYTDDLSDKLISLTIILSLLSILNIL